MSEWLSIILMWVVIFGGVACFWAISNRKDPAPCPPDPRQLCEWMAPCPVCGYREALVHVHGTQLYQGEDVECAHCGNKGTVEVYGPEEVDVNWEGE